MIFARKLALALLLTSSLLAHASDAGTASPAYDAGPDLTTAMGRELVEINASIPVFPTISKQLTGEQKYRPAFGPIPWRMLQKPNSVKILFIGQDGTHIAEAAGRPATASFGGRAQDLAAYFGVRDSAAFMNTYAFTIKGQYGSFAAPVLVSKDGGTPKAEFVSYVDNGLWLMTQDPASPIAQWRNKLIDWIIRNNRDSLRLIVLFGGAARDAAATFAESKGAKVATRMSLDRISTVQVPEIKLMYAGGNNEFAVPVSRSGGDLYAELMGSKPDYSKTEGMVAPDQENAKAAFADAMAADPAGTMSKLVLTRGGAFGTGIMHPGQLGGYDLNRMEVGGVRTLSLKGLSLSDGTTIQNDVLMAQLPHPSALSRLSKEQASKSVAKGLSAFKPYVDKGWTIEPDAGMANQFAAGKPYHYSRADIGPAYYDFGAPASRMVAVSDASRMSGQSHVIVFGTRDRAKFDMEAIAAMTTAQPVTMPSPDQMFVARPRTEETRFVFDAGPGAKYAQIMKTNMPYQWLSQPKEGMSFEKDGIDAYFIKSHPSSGDFGHYRGTFQKPRAVILADPEGYDDLITARALTGTRGQYLQGLMEDLGIGSQYLVIKTVPYGMDGATPFEWAAVLDQTRDYRNLIFDNIFADGKPELLIADGPGAEAELKRIVRGRGLKAMSSTVAIARDASVAGPRGNKAFGIAEALPRISTIPGFEAATSLKPRMADIPRSHLSYYARVWEGTSGDRVINSEDKFRGKAFAEVAPAWAFKQDAKQSDEEFRAVQGLLNRMVGSGLPLPGEGIPAFLLRKANSP